MLLVFMILSTCAYTSAEINVSQVNLTRGHVFFYDLTKHFNLSENGKFRMFGNRGNILSLYLHILFLLELQEGYRYSLSVPNGPDLPSWLFTKIDCKSKKAYLFGAPPIDSAITMLEVSVIFVKYSISISNVLCICLNCCRYGLVLLRIKILKLSRAP